MNEKDRKSIKKILDEADLFLFGGAYPYPWVYGWLQGRIKELIGVEIK